MEKGCCFKILSRSLTNARCFCIIILITFMNALLSNASENINASGLRWTSSVAMENNPSDIILSRSKRKVIPRGGYYILSRGSGSGIGSAGGSSGPWSSMGNTGQGNFDAIRRKWKDRKPSHIKSPLFPKDDTLNPYSSTTARKTKEKPHRQSISRGFKHEIAHFAMRNGAERAAIRYEHDVGRRLSKKTIKRYIKRYKKWKEKRSQKKSYV